MKRFRTVSPQAAATNPRGGTTLTEVLMSILCMGIGVVAVASLFPIALLRSVQATQLTSGTILRMNAETLMDIYDELPVMALDQSKNLLFNPDFAVDNPQAPTPVVADDDFVEHFGRNYLIDPLGAMIVRDDNSRPLGITDSVGRLDRFDSLRIFYPIPGYDDPMIAAADRGTAAQKQAEDIVTLPDSWVTLPEYDEFPGDQQAAGNMAQDTSIVLPNNSDVDYNELTDIITSGGAVRIVLFNKNGRLSEVRSLADTGIDGANNTISWTPALPNNNQYFPSANAGSDPGSVSRVRFEVKERRYTWMLTVRNDTSRSAVDPLTARARVDVVIFFRRSPSLEEETPYIITGSGRNYAVSPTTSEPFLKKGGFMLDTDTGTWHRILKVNGNNITLERNTQTLNNHQVVFMRGVVDVYPLGSKP